MAITLLTMFGCKSSKIDDISTTTAPYIKLKSGGGFSGKYMTYLLFENGQIFEQKSEFHSSTPVGSIEKNTAKQIFANYDLLNLNMVEHESYGNYTYSIVKQSGDQNHKIVWEKDEEGTAIYQVFFKNAMKAIDAKIQLASAKELIKNEANIKK